MVTIGELQNIIDEGVKYRSFRFISSFFKFENVSYLGGDYQAVYSINDDGSILDTEYPVLPCPPYCYGKINGVVHEMVYSSIELIGNNTINDIFNSSDMDYINAVEMNVHLISFLDNNGNKRMGFVKGIDGTYGDNPDLTNTSIVVVPNDL